MAVKRTRVDGQLSKDEYMLNSQGTESSGPVNPSTPSRVSSDDLANSNCRDCSLEPLPTLLLLGEWFRVVGRIGKQNLVVIFKLSIPLSTNGEETILPCYCMYCAFSNWLI